MPLPPHPNPQFHYSEKYIPELFSHSKNMSNIPNQNIFFLQKCETKTYTNWVLGLVLSRILARGWLPVLIPILRSN